MVFTETIRQRKLYLTALALKLVDKKATNFSAMTLEKRVSRHSILSQINEAGYLDPDTLNEARQMASLVLSVIKYPHEFFKNQTVDEQFYSTIGSLVSKMVTRIKTSDADDYHLNNETMMSTVEDIVSVIGFAMECTVIDRKRSKTENFKRFVIS